jgi:hypothetical protein
MVTVGLVVADGRGYVLLVWLDVVSSDSRGYCTTWPWIAWCGAVTSPVTGQVSMRTIRHTHIQPSDHEPPDLTAFRYNHPIFAGQHTTSSFDHDIHHQCIATFKRIPLLVLTMSQHAIIRHNYVYQPQGCGDLTGKNMCRLYDWTRICLEV